MEIVLKPNVRNKIIILLQQQKELQNQINNIIDVVAECENIVLTNTSIVNINDDVSAITISDTSKEK